MIKRLGYLIHWLAFLAAGAWGAGVWYMATHNNGVTANPWLVWAIPAGVVFGIGYCIDYVLTGNTAFLPED